MTATHDTGLSALCLFLNVKDLRTNLLFLVDTMAEVRVIPPDPNTFTAVTVRDYGLLKT